MQENYEILKDLIQTVGSLYYFTSLTVCSGGVKKRSSENEKWKKKEKKKKPWKWPVDHFQSSFFFFCPPDPKSENVFPISTHKKNLALPLILTALLHVAW